jgi:hypothetical protein
MDFPVTATQYAEKMNGVAIAAWIITLLIFITGFQRLKDIVAFVLMKWYEFFIQRNAISL